MDMNSLKRIELDEQTHRAMAKHYSNAAAECREMMEGTITLAEAVYRAVAFGHHIKVNELLAEAIISVLNEMKQDVLAIALKRLELAELDHLHEADLKHRQIAASIVGYRES